jgi:hypothetical protein
VELNISTLHEITNLFEELHWEIEDQKDNEFSLFNRFCSLMSLLEKEEQELIIELTRNQYLRVKFEEYNTLIEEAFSKAQKHSEKDFRKIKKIFVLPLLSPKDKGKIKSSSVVAYIFQNIEMQYKKLFSGKKIEVMSILEEKKVRKINENDEAILLIVDDFIGSGETAVACLEDVCNGSNVKKEKIVVLSLVSQETGESVVRGYGVEIYSAFTRKKGITDFYGDATSRKIRIMKKIEAKIKPSDKYRMGYNSSEALVSLIRTPNNTFPIYWLTKGNYKDKVPFPRW